MGPNHPWVKGSFGGRAAAPSRPPRGQPSLLSRPFRLPQVGEGDGDQSSVASAPKTPEPGGAGNRATDGRQPETARAWAGGISRASRKWWRWGSTPRPLSGLGSGRGGGPLRRGSCTPTSSLGAAERVLGRPRRPPLLSRPVGPGACGAALLCARWGTGPPAPLRLGLLCVTGVGVGVGGAAHFARPSWENQGARSLGNGVLTTTVCSVHERHSRHTRASTRTHMHTHVRAHTCTHTCKHMHTHAYACTHVRAHIYAHTCTCMHTCASTRAHTHVCVHARTRTHVAEAATVRPAVLHHVKRSWGTLQLLRAR